MKTVGLKQESKTGVRTVVTNCAVYEVRVSSGATILVPVAMLLKMLQKLVSKIFRLLLLDIPAVCSAIGFFLQRWRIVKRDATIDNIWLKRQGQL